MRTLPCGCKVKWFDRPGPACFSVKARCAEGRKVMFQPREMLKHLRQSEASQTEPKQVSLL